MHFSRKALMQLILPLVLEQFLSVAIGMADTIMVSTAGEAAVSGVSLVDDIGLEPMTLRTSSECSSQLS